MTTMNISLSPELKGFVDEQVADGGYVSTSEFVRDLIRQERDRQKLRGLILEGIESGFDGPVDEAYFDELRARISRSKA